MSDPKLINARDRIKQILDEEDIAGHVVLHNAPGSFEVFTKLDPSYSKLIGLPPVVRLRSKLVDYEGDTNKQRADLEATSNMVSGIAELTGTIAVQLYELAQFIDLKTGAEHSPMTSDNGPGAH